MQDAQTAKFAFDKIAEELGATIQDEACILGENDTNLSKEDADKIVIKLEEQLPVSNSAPHTAV